MAGLYAAGPGPEPLVLISVRPLMDHEGAAFLWLKTFIRGEFANGLVVEAPEAPCARPGEEGAGVAAVIVVPREKCRALAAGAQAKPHSLRPTHFCRRTGMATRTPVAPHPARGARPPPRPTGSARARFLSFRVCDKVWSQNCPDPNKLPEKMED